jgi:pyruvate formate lyase activating enzyme
VSDVKGILFHIIHGSFVDGYGIRTTVFLKGCPLRCLWCCNPEGQQPHRELKYTVAECSGCGKCLAVCKYQAITLDKDSEGTKAQILRELCSNCGDCVQVCYTGALDLFGFELTVDELYDLVKKDAQYYLASGGGVTIGGGEPAFQADFVRRFLKKCRENNIHTALDTCGYTSSPEGLLALQEADLLLYDIKHMDSQGHRKYTGVPNELILENLKKLNAAGKPIIIRIPLVPEISAADANVESTAAFLSHLKSVERVDLLAYHEYGKIKYDQLGREYTLNIQALSREHLNDIKKIFEKYGLKVQLGG